MTKVWTPHYNNHSTDEVNENDLYFPCGAYIPTLAVAIEKNTLRNERLSVKDLPKKKTNTN